MAYNSAYPPNNPNGGYQTAPYSGGHSSVPPNSNGNYPQTHAPPDPSTIPNPSYSSAPSASNYTPNGAIATHGDYQPQSPAGGPNPSVNGAAPVNAFTGNAMPADGQKLTECPPSTGDVMIIEHPDMGEFTEISQLAQLIKNHDQVNAHTDGGYVPYFNTNPCYNEPRHKTLISEKKPNGKASFTVKPFHLICGSWDMNKARPIARFGVGGFRSFTARGFTIDPKPGNHSLSLSFDADSVFVLSRMIKDVIIGFARQYPLCESIEDARKKIKSFNEYGLPNLREQGKSDAEIQQRLMNDIINELINTQSLFKLDDKAQLDATGKTTWVPDVDKGPCVSTFSFKTITKVIANKMNTGSYIQYEPVVPFGVKKVEHDADGNATRIVGDPIIGEELQTYDKTRLECVIYITVKGYQCSNDGIKLDYNVNYLELRKIMASSQAPSNGLMPTQRPMRQSSAAYAPQTGQYGPARNIDVQQYRTNPLQHSAQNNDEGYRANLATENVPHHFHSSASMADHNINSNMQHANVQQHQSHLGSLQQQQASAQQQFQNTGQHPGPSQQQQQQFQGAGHPQQGRTQQQQYQSTGQQQASVQQQLHQGSTQHTPQYTPTQPNTQPTQQYTPTQPITHQVTSSSPSQTYKPEDRAPARTFENGFEAESNLQHANYSQGGQNTLEFQDTQSQAYARPNDHAPNRVSANASYGTNSFAPNYAPQNNAYAPQSQGNAQHGAAHRQAIIQQTMADFDDNYFEQ